MKKKTKDFWIAAFVRAGRTVCQNLVSTIPVGFAVTPVMLQELKWSYVYIVLAWLATGVLAGVTSILTSIAGGLPEVAEVYEIDKGDIDG